MSWNGNDVSRRYFMGGVASLVTVGATGTARAAASQFKTITPGVLTVAAFGEMPASGIEDGKLVGLDGDMIMAIAPKLGLTVKPLVMDNAATIESVVSGRADIMIGNMRWTSRRAAVMSLSDAAYYVTYGSVTRKDSKLPNVVAIADLKGQRLATLTGAASSTDLKKVPDSGGVRFYDNSDAVIRDIIAGRVDFASLDPTMIAYLGSKNPGLNLKHITYKPDPQYPTLTGSSQAVFGMPLANPDLVDAVNAGLAWLKRTKQDRAIFAKYGLTDELYFTPLAENPRIGVDRDTSGNVTGPAAHKPKDFSALFS